MIKRIIKKTLVNFLLFVRGIINKRRIVNKEIAVACIARMEGHYIREFVEHYKSLGFSKCIIADNNHDEDSEDLSNILKDYIDDGVVIYEDYRNKVGYQMRCYAELYKKYGKYFGAIAFFDVDEFLVLPNHNSIYRFLKNKCKYDCVLINWLCFGDSNQVYADYSKPLNERFTEPCPIDTKVYYDFSENRHIKSIVFGGRKNVVFSNPHIPDYQKHFFCCNADGKMCDLSPFQPINYKNAYLKHFVTKSLQEWVEIKLQRGTGDRDYNAFRSHVRLDCFFKYNSMTKEKRQYLDSLKTRYV
jgi:hypothetical protein